jgi:hypothetical protein
MKEIEIRGKKFKIDLINNYVTRLYGDEFVPMNIELHITTQGMEPEATEALIGKTGDALRAAMVEQADILKEKTERIKELKKNICEMRLEIIQELLESNDYEFDKRWWERRTSVEDLNDFVLTFLKPDYKIEKKGKKKA